MRKRPTLAIATLVIALGAVVPASARADAPATVYSEAQRQEAEERWGEGRKLYEDGKIDEARLKYAQAFAVLQRTNILWNLAVAEFHSGRPLEALRHFKQFVRRPDALPDDVARATDKYIPEATRQTSHVKVDASPGLEVLVDDEVQPGATPLREEIDVAPGTHTVVARWHDRTESKTIACPAGQTVVVRFEVQPGSTKVVAVYPKARTFVAAGLGVAAVAATAVGVVFAMDSRSRDDEKSVILLDPGICRDRASPGCVAWQERLDAQQTSATLATAFYVGGGVLAAGALATYFLWPRAKTDGEGGGRALVTPEISGTGAGLRLGGTF